MPSSTSPSPSAQVDPLSAFALRFQSTDATIRGSLSAFNTVAARDDAGPIRASAAATADIIDNASAALHAQAAPAGLSDAVTKLLRDDRELSDGLRAINTNNLGYDQAVKDVIDQSISLRNDDAANVQAAVDRLLRARAASPSPSPT